MKSAGVALTFTARPCTYARGPPCVAVPILSINELSFQIGEAHSHGLERVLVFPVGILLHDGPAAAGAFCGGHDLAEVEISLADFFEHGNALGIHPVVLEMKEGGAALQPGKPFRRLAAARLHPV